MAAAETVESLKKSSIYGIVRRRYSKYIIIVMGKVLDFVKLTIWMIISKQLQQYICSERY